MGTSPRTVTATIDRGLDSSPVFQSRDLTVELWNKSPKANGQVIKFTGGSIFRKATDWFRRHSWLDLGGRQITTANNSTNPSQNEHAYTTPGGFRSDYIFTGMTLPSRIIGAASPGGIVPDIPSGMRNEAVTKALLKLANQQVNLGEDLATYGQTARMFAGASHSLADFLMNVWRDRDIRPYLWRSFRDMSRNAPKRLSDRYLEYIYGWKPLVQDVYALYKQATGNSLHALLLEGKATSNQQAQGGINVYPEVSTNSTTTLGPLDERCTVRCHLWAQIDPNWAGSRALNQLGLLNPASLVWEITPWSFVVDWILPIGSVLNALTAPAGLIFVDGSVAARYSATAPFEHWYRNYDNYRYLKSQHATGTYHTESYRRTHLTTWPLPGLWVDPDPLRGDRDFKAAALAISNLWKVRNSR